MSKKIVITGGAGFIGANLVQSFLKDERVERIRVIDNLSNGSIDNISEFLSHDKVDFFQDDICDYERMVDLTKGYDVISHQAALGSVPRSIKDPMTTTKVNIDGTVNILHAAVKNKIDRVILACSSSTYGDSMSLPKKEEIIGNPLSPYAITKFAIEQYAEVFSKVYGLNFIGLRYFNIFGPKQSPDNPYAAVIPIFCKAFIEGNSPTINGNGDTSRDFTYVDNAVLANVLAAFTDSNEALNEVYNVACGDQTTLNQMVEALNNITSKAIIPNYGPERKGDVKHSKADITKIKKHLKYEPKISFEDGLGKVYDWYKNRNN